MAWTGKHRAFIVENFLTNGESVIAALRNFRNHFQLRRRDPVPDRKSVLLWVKNKATAHTAKKSMDVLRGLFPAHLISLHGDIGWPARSPDLSPCDYFLWGYVKSEVFKHRPTTIDGLKAAICKTINEIPQEMIQRAMENFRIRLQQCIAVQGGHLEDVIFKK